MAMFHTVSSGIRTNVLYLLIFQQHSQQHAHRVLLTLGICRVYERHSHDSDFSTVFSIDFRQTTPMTTDQIDREEFVESPAVYGARHVNPTGLLLHPYSIRYSIERTSLNPIKIYNKVKERSKDIDVTTINTYCKRLVVVIFLVIVDNSEARI